ncbi:MAG: hypothetical protein DHS80DRAFT_22451 [Piptocephalis tieghemiana]|nr:MAG: hypothetical protein DHS80DRAFT_22451 [Piptocephalis tieghemiana]
MVMMIYVDQQFPFYPVEGVCVRIGCGGKHGPLHPYHLLLPPTPPSVSLFFPASPLSCHLRPLSPSLPQYQYSPSPSPSHGLLLDSRAKARHRKVNKYLFLSTPPPLPSSHLPPLNHRDIKAFCSKRSFIQDQLRRAKGGTAPTGPLKPRAIQAELAHYQDLYKKLKFNSREQTTKKSLLASLCKQPPPPMVQDETIQLQEEGNAQLKEQSRRSRMEIKGLEEDILAISQKLYSDRTEALSKTEEAKELLDEIEAMEAELAELGETDQEEEEAQSELHAQTEKLRLIYEEIEQAQASNTDLQDTIKTLQDEIQTLETEAHQVEVAAHRAIRKAKHSDPEVEHLCEWYTQAMELSSTLSGIQSVYSPSPTELILHLAAPYSPSTLSVLLHPETQAITGARRKESTGKNAPSLPIIDDIVEEAIRRNHLPFLITEILVRLSEPILAPSQGRG